MLADATGSILAYDALCRSNLSQSRGGSQYGSHSSDINEELDKDKSVMGSTHTLCQSDVDTGNSAGKTNGKDTEAVSETATAGKEIKESASSDTPVVVKHTEETVKKEQKEQECVLRHPTGRHNSVKVNITTSVDGCDSTRRTSSGSQFESLKFEFEVMDFFMLGSPLGLVLSYRKVYAGENKLSRSTL